MKPEAHEAAVLENIVPELEAEGFEVYSRPSGGLLPPFMQAYPPDAIALREDKKLAIEVVRKGSPSVNRLDRLRELLTAHRDWELRVYWINPANVPQPIEVASAKELQRAIETVEGLTVEGRLAPALLMAWAALEALGRAFLPEMLERPQTPARLLEVLANEGYITPDEADHLRQLRSAHNQVLHGGLHADIAASDIRGFVAILRTLLSLLHSERASNSN